MLLNLLQKGFELVCFLTFAKILTHDITGNEVQEHNNSIISAQWSFQKGLKLLLSGMDEVEKPLFRWEKWQLYSGQKVCGSRRRRKPYLLWSTEERTKILNEFLKPRLSNRSNTVSDIVTKNGVQFLCVKSGQCSKRHDKLLSARNKAALFSLAYLSPVRQGKEIWNTFLAMKPSLSSLFIRTWESLTNRKKVKHY